MRITHLDGLRGVAILLVFFYHAFARWTEIMPYGDVYADFPLFRYGKYGVQLFFLLSGFVIYMTLERTKTIPDFLYRRWLRLFPAMLVCSLLIFLTAPLMLYRPAGLPELVDLLPGISLIEPYYLTAVTGLSFSPLEASFWSIYVEVKFYIFAAVVYFLFSKEHLPWFIVGAFIFWWIIVESPIISDWQFLEPIRWRLHFTSIEYFGWFASGCFLYQYQKKSEIPKLLNALTIGIASSLVAGGWFTDVTVALLIILCLFVLGLRWTLFQKVLSSKPLQFYGFISYPLYLLHENFMVSLIVQLAEKFHILPVQFWPIIVLITLMCITFLIAKYTEPALKSLLIITIRPRIRQIT